MMDTWLLEFVRDNFLTIGLVLGILKILARYTSWAADDEIVQFLLGWVGGSKQPPKPEKKPPEEKTTSPSRVVKNL